MYNKLCEKNNKKYAWIQIKFYMGQESEEKNSKFKFWLCKIRLLYKKLIVQKKIFDYAFMFIKKHGRSSSIGAKM